MDYKLKLLFRNVAIRKSIFPCLDKNKDLEYLVKKGIRVVRDRALGNSEFGTKGLGQMYSLISNSGMIRNRDYICVNGEIVHNPRVWTKEGDKYTKDNSMIDKIIAKLLDKRFDCGDRSFFQIYFKEGRYHLTSFRY